MALALQSITQTLVGANDSTPTFNMPATRPDGDLYLLFLAVDGDPKIITFTGWTQLVTTADEGTVGVAVFWRIGSSEPASYTGANLDWHRSSGANSGSSNCCFNQSTISWIF